MVVGFMFAIREIGSHDLDWIFVGYTDIHDPSFGPIDLVKQVEIYADMFEWVGWEIHPEIGVTVRPDE